MSCVYRVPSIGQYKTSGCQSFDWALGLRPRWGWAGGGLRRACGPRFVRQIKEDRKGASFQ